MAEPRVTTPEDASDAVAPVSDRHLQSEGAGQRPALLEGEGPINAWPDESAESAMLSELRSRGEPAMPAPAATEAVEETDPKNLPSLDELVQRIPAGVREVVDDLFRAKFVRVTRVPKQALKE